MIIKCKIEIVKEQVYIVTILFLFIQQKEFNSALQ